MDTKLDLSLFHENQFLQDLMYRSYRWNRLNAPHIEATRWRTLYLNQEEYEKKFQEEKNVPIHA